jgi:hypothetical protein
LAAVPLFMPPTQGFCGIEPPKAFAGGALAVL